MKPTQIAELFANIKATFVSFFSIFMFVALGVGIFLGISWSGPALQMAANHMYDEGRFHNFQIQFPYGLTADDLSQLAAVEGVTQVEEGRQSFQVLRRDGINSTVKVQSLSRDIDAPMIVEGELPTGSNEMAFHAESAKLLGVGVGDVVAFERDVAESEAAESQSGPNGASSAGRGDVSDGMRYLAGNEFTVTAIINSADYAAKSAETYGYSDRPSGAVDALAWVPDAAFDAAAFQDGYPIVNVRCEELEGVDTFGADYDAKSDQIKERLDTLGKELSQARYEQLHGDAQVQLDDAQKQLDEAKAKIDDGEKQVADGQARLDQGRAELDAAVSSGEAELAQAYDELMAGEDQLAQAERELNSAASKLDAAQAELDVVDAAKSTANSAIAEMRSYKSEQDKALASGEITRKEYNANLDKSGAQISKRIAPIAKRMDVSVPTIDHTNYGDAVDLLQEAVDGVEDVTVKIEGESMTVGQARTRLARYKRDYANGVSEYNAKSDELSDGWNQYYAGQDELESRKAQGERELADGAAELENAKKQLEDAKSEVAANEPKLDDAKKKVEALKRIDWSVLPRAYNAGVVQIVTFSDVTHSLSISMAALFIIVGLLVSYFAVSRIVSEQVVQIGTKKALGFHRGEITKSFAFYAGIAVLAGALAGAMLGYTVVEGIIGGVLADMFAFGTYPPYFGFELFAVITLLEFGLILGATFFACHRILKRHAVELLRGDEKPMGKEHFYEKWGIWDRLPLFVQTIVNNCVNDKRRMLSTIIGVAGSAALIVTAITLNNDVMKSYDRHYEDAYGFNAIAYVDNGVEGAIDEVESNLRSEGATTARVFMKRYLMEQPDGASGAMRIIVPSDEEAFEQVYHINPTTGGKVDLTAEGAWVSQAYGEHMGAKVGDLICVDAGDGTKHEVPILGFCKFWLTYHEMVMGADYFEKEFGGGAANALFVQTNGASVDGLRSAAQSVEGFDSIVDDAGYQHKNFETFSSVSSAVVAIYLVLAIFMAIVVLLNLNVMFIMEKKRELIVLMINGFSVKDAKSYIAYDSVVLTALGIIVGIVLGCLMGSSTVMAIEPSTGVFVKSPDVWAILIGVVGSAILALIMSVIALRRIPKFALTDINKQ